MVRQPSRTEVGLGIPEDFDRRPALPAGHVPPHVVCFGQGVGPQVAVGFLRLLEHGDGVGEELIEEGGVPEPQAGDHDDGHYDLPPKASPRAAAVFLAMPNSLTMREMTRPPPCTWNTVASPSRVRCTVAVEAADCFTFSASRSPLPCVVTS